MALNLALLLSIQGKFTRNVDLAEAISDVQYSKQVNLTTGVAAGQADEIFHDRRTVASGATDTLDLAGSLQNIFGQVVNFARIKAMYIVAADANTTVLSVGPAGSNGFLGPHNAAADRHRLGAGQFYGWARADATAFPVTPGTADQYVVVNAAGAAADYDIIIVGATA
jgi:hypothetical protein